MKGYTLIEILVTIAIVAIGATLVMPSLDRARSGAQRSACLSNLRQIGQASLTYHAEEQTILPWCVESQNSGNGDNYWWESLAPYVGPSKKVFKCPMDKNFSEASENDTERTVSYGWNYKLAGHGDTGMNGPDFVRIQNYAKPSRVLIASDGPGGAAAGQEDSWGYIDERAIHEADPKRHNGYGNALFLDGHVEAIKTTEFPNNPLYQDRTQHLQ
jgi:prepilin-type processing-associated H-X9-DG protein/prepilin-type N-terminal cleavage/methylation domain-containing protein